MGRTWLACLLGAVLVGGLPTTVSLVATDQSANDHRTAPAASQRTAPAGASAEPGDTDVDADDKSDRKQQTGGRGFGPPPWAHWQGRQGQGGEDGAGASWKDAWRKLTPAQRARKMATLAKTHTEGMRKWADCITAAGNDPAKRAACEKPLPPGLAKRQP
jgi:hypothetical protein